MERSSAVCADHGHPGLVAGYLAELQSRFVGQLKGCGCRQGTAREAIRRSWLDGARLSKHQTRLLRLPGVLERTALSQSSVYRLIADNAFPSPVKLSKRSVAWVEHEVEGWIADRLRTRSRAGAAANGPPTAKGATGRATLVEHQNGRITRSVQESAPTSEIVQLCTSPAVTMSAGSEETFSCPLVFRPQHTGSPSVDTAQV